MLAAIEFDEWPEAAHTHAHAARSTHPLGVFDPRECGAWIDTLRALRALPNRVRAPDPAGASGSRNDANDDGDA
ncbi:hypothetical protein [Dokdonella sp.]|jgi:hypothetical protein|uniref:hypothetical protein n=1 Tax=Dokdonella sp. TaxID=2291710 RepID=UPI002F415E9A